MAEEPLQNIVLLESSVPEIILPFSFCAMKRGGCGGFPCLPMRLQEAERDKPHHPLQPSMVDTQGVMTCGPDNAGSRNVRFHKCCSGPRNKLHNTLEAT